MWLRNSKPTRTQVIEVEPGMYSILVHYPPACDNYGVIPDLKSFSIFWCKVGQRTPGTELHPWATTNVDLAIQIAQFLLKPEEERIVWDSGAPDE
jgi:hypothetical protein